MKFSCLKCFCQFLVEKIKTPVGETWGNVECPACGSLYAKATDEQKPTTNK